MGHGRFETYSSKPEIDFLHSKQVHGVDIVSPETLPCDADGIFISWGDFTKPVAIKTADCLPVIIEGEKGFVFLHAGWRGLANGILERPEIAMMKPMNAFIGPSIHACCFEVSYDFKTNFPQSDFFSNRDNKIYFDLQKEATARLKKRYPEINVSDSEKCTCCDTSFHSHRRDKTSERNFHLYIKG